MYTSTRSQLKLHTHHISDLLYYSPPRTHNSFHHSSNQTGNSPPIQLTSPTIMSTSQTILELSDSYINGKRGQDVTVTERKRCSPRGIRTTHLLLSGQMS